MAEGLKAVYTLKVFDLLDFVKPFESSEEYLSGINSRNSILIWHWEQNLPPS